MRCVRFVSSYHERATLCQQLPHNAELLPTPLAVHVMERWPFVAAPGQNHIGVLGEARHAQRGAGNDHLTDKPLVHGVPDACADGPGILRIHPGLEP